jgi:hypothetical protein
MFKFRELSLISEVPRVHSPLVISGIRGTCVYTRTLSLIAEVPRVCTPHVLSKIRGTTYL